MPTLSEIHIQLSQVDGIQMIIGRKEIKELPNILWNDEKIENIIMGTYNNGNGILVATNKRLVFVDKGLFFGLKVEDFPYEKISTIQYETGILLGKLTIYTTNNKAIIDNVSNVRIRSFADWLRARISGTSKNLITEQITGQSTHSNIDVADQLEKLANLKEKGILTEEEFLQQKKKLLSL